MSTMTDRRLGLSASLALKAPVRIATTANITLSGFQTIDGVLPTTAEHPDLRRILVKNQTDAAENGIYVMDTGPWARAKDFNGVNDIREGTRVLAVEGSTQFGFYVVSSSVDPYTFTIDEDDITFISALSIDTFTGRHANNVSRTILGKLREARSILDWIPEALHEDILDFTSTTDVASYWDTALSEIDDAGGGTLLAPAGRYTVASAIGETGLSNIRVLGEGGRDLTYSGTTGTVIRATITGADEIVNMQNHRGVWWEDLQVVYTSDSFTGTIFNCATTFTTGCGSGFRNVQVYQITGNTHSAAQCWFLRNNVDVTFEGCYASHAAFGWVGLFDSDTTSPTNETNIIRLVDCTSIALRTAAIVNPIIGWQLRGCNFELSDTDTPAGILATGAHTVTNLGIYACVFADSTAAGTWINLPVNIFNLTMIGGAVLTAAVSPTGTAMILGNTVCSGLVIHGVLFSGLSIGITLAASGTIASIIGNEFLNCTTALSGAANLDATALVLANQGLTSRALGATSGGTGQTGYTIGDILAADTTTTLAKLTAVASGNLLRSAGVSTLPAWGKATSAHLSGTANRLFGTDGSGGGAEVTLPAAGLTLSAGALALANDLAALEALTGTGVPRRTGVDTWGLDASAADLTNGVFGAGAIVLATGAKFLHTKTASIDFNSANTDNAFTITLPTGFTRWQLTSVVISGASGTLTTATCGVFTATGGGGTALVASGTAITVSTASEDTANNLQALTITNNSNQSHNQTTIYFRVQTPQGSAATATVEIGWTPVS